MGARIGLLGSASVTSIRLLDSALQRRGAQTLCLQLQRDTHQSLTIESPGLHAGELALDRLDAAYHYQVLFTMHLKIKATARHEPEKKEADKNNNNP